MESRHRPAVQRVLNVLETVVGTLCELLLAGVLVLGTLGILSRYLPVPQPIWLGQMAIFFGVWMYFLGFVVAAKREEYIFIEFFHKFIPPKLWAVLDLVLHLAMIAFALITLVAGWPLQVLQSRMMVTSFPLPQNFFSLSVIVSMALILLILIPYTWERLKRVVEAFNPGTQDSSP